MIAAAPPTDDRRVVDALDAIVPFLGTLAERQLLSSIDRVLAIVTGASCDLDGGDAADKLVLLASLFGWGTIERRTLDVSGFRGVSADDLAAALAAGGALKPVVSGSRDGAGVRAFVGPAWLPASEPLAVLGGALNGICLDGRDVSDLFFSGPAPGRAAIATPEPARSVVATPPVTSWFARVTFPGVVPPDGAVARLVCATGMRVERVVDYATDSSRWLLIGAHSRADILRTAQRLAETHRIETVLFRRITNLSSNSSNPPTLATTQASYGETSPKRPLAAKAGLLS